MDASVMKRFNALEARREALVARVKALPEDDQCRRPSAKEMSPSQLLMHFAIVEAQSVERMTKTPPAFFKGKPSKTTFIYKKAVAQMAAAKRIGAPPGVFPKVPVITEEAAKQWELVRTALRDFFEKVENPDDAMQKFIFFGSMSANDLLTLYESHMTYHETLFPDV